MLCFGFLRFCYATRDEPEALKPKPECFAECFPGTLLLLMTMTMMMTMRLVVMMMTTTAEMSQTRMLAMTMVNGMRMVAIASAMKDLLAVLLSSTSAASARCRIHRCSFLSGPTPNRNPACILRALKPSGKPREFRSAGCDSALRRGPDYLRMGP